MSVLAGVQFLKDPHHVGREGAGKPSCCNVGLQTLRTRWGGGGCLTRRPVHIRLVQGPTGAEVQGHAGTSAWGPNEPCDRSGSRLCVWEYHVQTPARRQSIPRFIAVLLTTSGTHRDGTSKEWYSLVTSPLDTRSPSHDIK